MHSAFFESIWSVAHVYLCQASTMMQGAAVQVPLGTSWSVRCTFVLGGLFQPRGSSRGVTLREWGARWM